MATVSERSGSHALETLAIALDELFCPCCDDDLGAAIAGLPHVTGVHVDLAAKVAHVTVRAGLTDERMLSAQIRACNFKNPVPLPGAQVSTDEAMHQAAARTEAHGGHAAMGRS